ncbi:proline transporter 1-like [Beta vulgaris subsp. vulgaris]|uniref:proline transporter 1-like n=1 Tax=Beta vulgaris subsp. vulgaris TaxID=3555 RepID=UPI002546C851|nr:proline transporter 1-like [Beta vulgaris subsp. vulgaris]
MEAGIGSSRTSRTSRNSSLRSLSLRDQFPEDCPPTAHTIGHDSWQQAGVLLATSFNCGWIFSFSNLLLVPLGWGWGIPTLVIVGAFSCYANYVLAEFHYIGGHRFIRYRDIMGHLFGKGMYYLTWFLQFSTFILTNMGFILLGGRALKEINQAFSDTPLRLQYFIIITGVIYFIFAYIIPNLSAMRMWLGVSMILTFSFIGVFLAALVIDGKTHKHTHRNYEVSGRQLHKVFNGLSALSAAIASNNSGMLPEIQSTLQEPVVKNMRRALYVQFTVGIMFYYGVSVAGYLVYGSEVSEYLPNNLSGPKWAVVFINAAVFLQNVISQHMFVQPVHEALDTRFLNFQESLYSKGNLIRRLFLRASLFTVNSFVTAAIPFMGDFINLLGSFTLVALTFIFPSMIFLKIKGNTVKVGEKAWHCAIIIVLSIIAVVTTASAFRLIVDNIADYRIFSNE